MTGGKVEALIAQVRESLARPMPLGQEAKCAVAVHDVSTLARLKEALTSDEWRRVEIVEPPAEPDWSSAE